MTPNGDDDDDLDDASLKSMRAVWLSMRDEEPPAAGMSALLAAAAEKAEHMRDPSQPWWQRAFAMLRRPPALAFATVMILIGGAVLVTRTADKKTDAEMATPAPVQGPEARVDNVQAGSGAIAAPVEEPTETLKDSPPPPPPPPAKPPAKIAKPTKPAEVKEKAKPEPNRYERFEDGAANTEAQKGEGADGDISGTTLDSPGRVKTQDKSPVVKQAPEAPADSIEAKPQPRRETETTTGAKQPEAPIEQLARQAETAATRGDCAAVKAIVARIKQQDEAFFKTRLGKSAAVTKCL